MNTRPLNASLYVDAFSPTGNPGEYTFENALFRNQADQSGNGAYDVQEGFVLYVPSTNFNTGAPIPGVVHRYKLTSVTIVDPERVSGTMIWDETGAEELEVPTNGIGCGLSAVSASYGFGYAPADALYSELPLGLTEQSIQTDLWNIVDQIESGGTGPGPSGGVYKTTLGDSTTTSFVVHHALGTRDITVTVYDLTTGEDVFAGVTRTGPDDVRIDFTYPIETNSNRVIVRS